MSLSLERMFDMFDMYDICVSMHTHMYTHTKQSIDETIIFYNKQYERRQDDYRLKSSASSSRAQSEFISISKHNYVLSKNIHFLLA